MFYWSASHGQMREAGGGIADNSAKFVETSTPDRLCRRRSGLSVPALIWPGNAGTMDSVHGRRPDECLGNQRRSEVAGMVHLADARRWQDGIDEGGLFPSSGTDGSLGRNHALSEAEGCAGIADPRRVETRLCTVGRRG